MRSRPKREIERTISHKGTTDFQKIEREKRLQRREERRERAIALQRGMRTRVTDQERSLQELGHDRHEEGAEEEASPLEEYLCIEKQEALQLEVP